MSIKLSNLATTGAFASGNSFLIETSAGGKRVLQPNALNLIMPNNAAAHNSVYRGKYLGDSVSATVYNAINAGTFDPSDVGGLFPGDYWTIGGVNYRIGALDYWYKTGDTQCTKHHVLLVPDAGMYNAQMHVTESGGYEEGEDNTTAGGYMGTDMYTTGLSTAKATITAAFGSSHILSHRELLSNAVTNGYSSGHTWVDSTVELMTEEMVYGGKEFKNCENGTSWPYNYTIDNAQLPLFAHDHSKICTRAAWWLRDVASATFFCIVSATGLCNAANATDASGVRPAFAICA